MEFLAKLRVALRQQVDGFQCGMVFDTGHFLARLGYLSPTVLERRFYEK